MIPIYQAQLIQVQKDNSMDFRKKDLKARFYIN